MQNRRRPSSAFAGLLLLFLLLQSVVAAPRQLASGHVPPVVAQGKLKPLGRLAGTNVLHLAIALPLREAAALTNFLRELYNPASPQFHHYLTPAEFTARFGPTPADYAAVCRFAEANGLVIKATHPNRLVLDVTGKVSDVERAFQVRLNSFRHPREARDFFAPDAEPSVAGALPLLHVSGLDTYSRPHPNLRSLPVTTPLKASPRGGSSPNGGFMGNDFRKAYVADTTLTGAGQNVALLQFDGFYARDITNYLNSIGLTNNVPQVVVVPVNGGVPVPGNGNIEVSLDIEMVLSMAPGVSNIYVYEAPNNIFFFDDLLSQMANDNFARQISCSWGGGGPNPSAEQIFLQMAAQGQSFFNASGDSDAFTGSVPFPSESPNITQVGGTTLTTDGSGNYDSETVWNWGFVPYANGYLGSSGGISTQVEIPAWQQGLDMTTNLGSTSMRNIPDVALTADGVYVVYNNGSDGLVGGTSAASPLWAGFAALVNEQATRAGRPPVGFINPAVYAIGTNSSYTNCFHDTTVGDNFSAASPDNFPATAGYDLCTGWGTPTGQSLMDALAGPPEPLNLLPDGSSFNAVIGPAGGDFSSVLQTVSLTNLSSASLDWSIINPAAWLDVSTNGGTLAGAEHVEVGVSLNSLANSFPAGTYSTTVIFSNQTSGIFQSRQFNLRVINPISLLSPGAMSICGPAGGPFYPGTQTIAFTNLGVNEISWSLINTSQWLTVSPGDGVIPTNGFVSMSVTTNVNLPGLANGIYQTTLVLSNGNWHDTIDITLSAFVGVNIVRNGGFETGDFTAWNLVGTTVIGNDYYNIVSTEGFFPGTVHSGTFGAFLGQGGFLATLTQTLPTCPGQLYQLSFWLHNPVAGSGQQFLADWDAVNLVDLSSPPAFGWTNFQFLVTASGTNTDLRFAARNDANYFGFDDVSVTPVPTVMFATASNSSGDLQFGWNSLAGLNYEIQFTTNLAAADWQVLGDITADTNVCGLVDTNILNGDSQRFYRLLLQP